MVTPAAPTVTWADPASIVSGTPLSSARLDATADVPGTFTDSPAAGTVPGVGNNQSLSVTFAPTDSTGASATATLNVLPAALTDGRAPDRVLYFLDWDPERVQISGASTGAVLSTLTATAFQSGAYLDYAVSGDVVITITKGAGTSNVLSGLFFN